MLKRTLALAALAGLVSAGPALAQSERVEVSAILGWTFADGVSGTAVKAGDGNTYDRVDPTDSFKWGLGFGLLATDNVEVGFMYGQQKSSLEISGTTTKDLGDFNVNNYHGYFAYNFGDSRAKMRPYVLGGIGATNYGTVSFTKTGGATAEVGGNTQFSTTWGAGVKFYATPNVGARFGVQWTPTYIKTDSDGWWCDPWWGCYVVGNAQYSNQWDFSGGIVFRF